MKTCIVILLFCTTLLTCNTTNKNHIISEVKTPEINYSTDLKQSMKRGKEVYNDLCITCHMPNGKGVPKTFPPLANSDYLMNNRAKSIKAIKYGLSGEIKVNGENYNMPMTPPGLSADEVADVMNYITNSWGNKNQSIVTEKEVSKIKP